ncbi:MAG: alpha/beta fold hydrolase [Mycobacteriales bacterium]
MAKTEIKVKSGDVVLPITVSGAGRKLIFFNGICSTRVVWSQVIARLKGRYEVVTFDFRGHGGASASRDHSFDAFLGDAAAVMAAVGSEQPVLVAWSFGADLALAYAAAHPGALDGLVIVDGALPLTDRLVDDERKMRRLLNSFSMKFSMLLMKLTPYKYSLTGDDVADIAILADDSRQRLLDVYARIDCPVVMLLATKTAGENTTEHAKRNNKLWREAADRLAARYPSISIKWLDAGHRLPLTRAGELAQAIDQFVNSLGNGCTNELAAPANGSS